MRSRLALTVVEGMVPRTGQAWAVGGLGTDRRGRQEMVLTIMDH